MCKLSNAINLATKKHAGQLDKAGKPYIEHCLRVMAAVETEHQKIVAILHDVIEDCGVTADDLLIKHSVDRFVVDDVIKLTKIQGEDYFTYLGRIKKSKTATAVKIADLRDNMDLSRYTGIFTPTMVEVAKVGKRQKKYAEALRFLTSD
jgi:guanosine-3',5'-bis(diphosphate) 3'-pyrophosphohydrolase